LLLLESIWLWVLLALGGLCCWFIYLRTVGRAQRWIGIAICAFVFFLPVGWKEGRRVHWSWLQPCIGEPLDAVVSRLGAAEPAANGQWTIVYAAPFYWVIPQFGFIRISTNPAGQVESWDVTWR
jgi:hypothetical protein